MAGRGEKPTPYRARRSSLGNFTQGPAPRRLFSKRLELEGWDRSHSTRLAEQLGTSESFRAIPPAVWPSGAKNIPRTRARASSLGNFTQGPASRRLSPKRLELEGWDRSHSTRLAEQLGTSESFRAIPPAVWPSGAKNRNPTPSSDPPKIVFRKFRRNRRRDHSETST